MTGKYWIVLCLAVSSLAPLAVRAQSETGWSYQFTPYLWATSIDGTQGIGGRDFDVDASASDLLDFLDIALAGRLEGQGPQWGWFGDAFYAKLSDETNLPTGTLDGRFKQTILEGGLSYRFSEMLDGLAGVRYQELDARLRFPALGTLRGDEGWVDGFVGLRLKTPDAGKWRAWLRGDIGAGDSDLVWSATVGGGYQFNETVSLLVAYRHLDTDYEKDGFKWDIAMSGLGLGLGISW
jgi:hypothetical protein